MFVACRRRAGDRSTSAGTEHFNNVADGSHDC